MLQKAHEEAVSDLCRWKENPRGQPGKVERYDYTIRKKWKETGLMFSAGRMTNARPAHKIALRCNMAN